MTISILASAALAACTTGIDLDGTWAFRFEEQKPLVAAWNTAFEATDEIAVPGCFDAMPKWLMKRGTGLYRRAFTLDRAVENAWLVVDGMGFTSRFAVDGRDIGGCDLPWSRFELPTGPLAAGEHTLVAAVDNRFDFTTQKLVRNFYDFHCYGGFFHGLSLSFDNRRLFVRTRDWKTGEVEIEVRGQRSEVRGQRSEVGDFETTLVFDGKNEVTAKFVNGRATVKVPDFKLWSPDHPNLHTVTLHQSPTTKFGIRTIEARDRGLYLNGERIFLRGVNRHEQRLEDGAATTERQMREDIRLLKEMGGNFIRGAHYPQSQRFLDLCDENGILVWEESLGWGNGQGYTKTDGIDELTDGGFVDAQLRQTKLMVRNSFNHPSVIIFGFLNELNSQLPEAKALADKLIDAIRAEDSGRLVTFACNMCTVDLVNEKTDLISVNTYPGHLNGWAGLPDELKVRVREMPCHGLDWLARFFRGKYPDRTIIVSEIGGSGRYGALDPSAAFDTEEFQAEYNGDALETAYANPDIAGIALWQLFDTRTHYRDCGRRGMRRESMSHAGLFDAARRPKKTVAVVSDFYRNRVPANLKAVREGMKRTLLVHPDEFTDRWVDRAVELGLDCLTIHPEGGPTAYRSLDRLLKRLEDPAFRARIDRAREKGLEVGYELHAAGWLLPRALFEEHPEYFRQASDGSRVAAINFCFSNETALDIAAKRAVELVARLYGSSHRYCLWLDDVRDGACQCEKCRAFSASDQQLLFVNRVLAELQRTIPDAQLCHLAYEGTLAPPTKVRPAAGVFLEFAPISRDLKRPLAEQPAAVAPLGKLLETFGCGNARILDYWFDNSLLSGWRKPPKQFAADASVVWQDLAFYRDLGVSDVASFACFLGDDYEQLWGAPDVRAFARGFAAFRGGRDRTDFTWKVTDGRFRFAFSVVDATVSAVEPFKAKRDLERGDRVEIFFSPVADLSKSYYCAEIDPKGRVLDYGCVFPRRFDYDWSFKTLERRVERTPDGYRVEGSVALAELKELGIDPDHCWIGAFRADFDVHEQLVDWYSLVPHGPGEADFHRPCQFFKIRY